MSYLDTRDLNERLTELEEAEQTYIDAKQVLADYDEDDQDEIALLEEALSEAEDNFSEDDGKELDELRNLRDEVGSEWPYGETLIPEGEFEEYVEEHCKDCGYISRDLPYWIEIAWDKTAQNISVNYKLVTYQGEEYYVRNY